MPAFEAFRVFFLWDYFLIFPRRPSQEQADSLVQV